MSERQNRMEEKYFNRNIKQNAETAPRANVQVFRSDADD